VKTQLAGRAALPRAIGPAGNIAIDQPGLFDDGRAAKRSKSRSTCWMTTRHIHAPSV
jgi:hypothetical protein